MDGGVLDCGHAAVTSLVLLRRKAMVVLGMVRRMRICAVVVITRMGM